MHLYEPTGVLKPVGDGIWIVDGGISWMTLAVGLRIPFPTRMVVIALPSTKLLVWSPIAPSDALRSEIDRLGTVSHLVSPNKLHYAQMAPWQQAYPEATAWASPGVQERARSHGIPLRFDADLGDQPDAAWEGVLDQMLFRGSRFLEEVVFFHRPSRTLILADLIENFEPARLSASMRAITHLVGASDPDGKATLNFRMTFVGNHRKARVSLARMLAWEPEKVVLAHGRWYEGNAAAELRRAFRWLAPAKALSG
jgi:hypothetical protein